MRRLGRLPEKETAVTVSRRILAPAAALTMVVWLIAQALLIVHSSGLTPDGDAAYYLGLARDCIEAGRPYPLPGHVADHAYIANPGYINLLAATISLFGRDTAGLWLNLLLNSALLAVIFALTRRLLGLRTALMATIIYCLVPSDTFIVAGYMSELPFALAAFAAMLEATRPGRRHLVAAGLLLVVANYVRPAGMVFVATLVLCVLTSPGRRLRRLALLVGTLVAATMTLWLVNGAATGTRYCFSTTGGINALLGANPTANGAYEPQVLEPGREADIPDSLRLDVFRKDSLWKARALDWALSHPHNSPRWRHARYMSRCSPTPTTRPSSARRPAARRAPTDA